MNKYRKHFTKLKGHCNKYYISIIPYQYKCNFELLEDMLKVAQQDFKTLKKENVEIVQQGGDYCNGMYALEFKTGETPNSEYIETSINPRK